MSPHLPAILLALLPVFQEPEAAGGAADERSRNPLTERPNAVAIRTERAPIIDGDTTDDVWSEAPQIAAITQVEPDTGVPGSELTEVRVLYDSLNIYFAVRCFDREPGLIVATQMARDSNTFLDDRIQILIDTFLDRRNAFEFNISAAGGRADALVSDNGAIVNDNWSGIWEGRSRITALGWEAEIRIPFQSMAFDPYIDTWGFNVARLIRRRVEFDRWASPSRDFGFQQVGVAGTLSGLHGLEQGLGLDLKPYASLRFDHADATGDDDLLFDAGGDILYRVTPALTAQLTINTDFAETEVDARQVNLTRFPLFFPEKRDFFLEDASLFEFSDLDSGLIPFFSRRIGLSNDGQVIPILWGAKVAGRASPFNIGALHVQTDDEGDIDSQQLSVARVSANVLDESTVGGIFTSGDPTGETDNLLYGFDFNYRRSDFLGDKNFIARLFGLQSQTSGLSGDDVSYGGEISYPNDFLSATVQFREIQENFNPALGFLSRSDIRQYNANLRIGPRPDLPWLRRLLFSVTPALITDLSNEVETGIVAIQPFGAIFESGDELYLTVTPQYERLDADFEINEGVIIPEDSYSFTRGGVRFEGGSKRWITPSFAYTAGEFFDGTRQDLLAGMQIKPSRYFFFQPQYEQNDVQLPGGDFTVRIMSLRAVVNFTPDISWSNLLQFDNQSDTLGLNSRLHWIIEDGQELFLVLNHGWNQDDGGFDFHSTDYDITMKLEYTFRF